MLKTAKLIAAVAIPLVIVLYVLFFKSQKIGSNFKVETTQNLVISPTYTLNYTDCPAAWLPNCGASGLTISDNHELVMALPKVTPLGLYEVSIAFYDDNQTGVLVALDELANEQIVNSVTLGIHPAPIVTPAVTSEYYYAFAINGQSYPLRSGFKRTPQQFHTATIRVTPHGTYGVIDGLSLSFLPATGLTQGGVNRQQVRAHQLRLGRMGTSGTVIFKNLSLGTSVTDALYRQIIAHPHEYQAVEKYYALFLLDNEAALWHWLADLPVNEQNRTLLAQAALIYAFAYRQQSANDRSPCSTITTSLQAMPTANYCDKARHLIRQMAIQYPAWHHSRSSYLAYTAYDLALGYGLISQDIDLSERGLLTQTLNLTNTTARWVISALDTEADFWTKRIDKIRQTPHAFDEAYISPVYTPTYLNGFSRYLVDTAVEDNGVKAMFLALWDKLRTDYLCTPYPQQGYTARWHLPAQFYGFHTLTKGERDNLPGYGLFSQTLSERKDIKKWVIENHQYSPSPNYAFSLEGAAKVYVATHQTDDSTFDRNQQELWLEAKNYYSAQTFLFTPPSYMIYYLFPSSTTITTTAPPGNIFAITGQGDWLDDASWYPTAFAYAAKRWGDDELYHELQKHLLATRPDYLAFPITSTGVLTFVKPSEVTTAAMYEYPKYYYSYHNAMLHALILSERHIAAYLIYEDDQTLWQTLPTTCTAMSK